MSSLRRRAFSGVKWTSISTGATSFLQFITFAILANLLSQEAFGLLGMIMVVIGFARAYSDGGISKAIIQRQNVSSDELSSLYWLNIGFGILTYGLILLAIPLITWFYREPRLDALVVGAGLVFLIKPLGQQFKVLLKKELEFDLLAQIEIFAEVAMLGVSVAMAFAGFGVWSIIGGQLARAGGATLCFVVVGWRRWTPYVRFKIDDVRRFVGFGAYQVGERSVNYLAANVDYMLVGRYLGEVALGNYLLAYNLVVLPLTKINPALTRVAFPVFSKQQRDTAALQKGYCELTRALSIVVFPMLVGLAAVAPVFIPAVYGAKWELAIPLVQILAVLGMAKTLGNPRGSIYLARGRADLGFKWNLFQACLNSLVFYWAVHQGLFFLAGAYAAVTLLYFILGHEVLIKQVVQLPFVRYLRVLVRPTLYTLCMGVIVIGVHLILAPIALHQWMLLGVLIGLGVGVYGGLLYLYEWSYVTDLYSRIMR